jgi:hypothetical protein
MVRPQGNVLPVQPTDLAQLCRLRMLGPIEILHRVGIDTALDPRRKALPSRAGDSRSLGTQVRNGIVGHGFKLGHVAIGETRWIERRARTPVQITQLKHDTIVPDVPACPTP